jgi:hypothetical protein
MPSDLYIVAELVIVTFFYSAINLEIRTLRTVSMMGTSLARASARNRRPCGSQLTEDEIADNTF